jgi:hypothetical protein
MAIEMDWSPDFCLSCDRQTSGGAYCSQSCRLADLERASNGSSPSSPLTLDSSPSWGLEVGSGFYLPPALNFAAYSAQAKQTAPAMRSPTSPTSFNFSTALSKGQFYAPALTRSASAGAVPIRTLTPSTSRTSLSSLQSTSSQASYLSDEARNELRNYASSFDHVRDWKRRMTLA